MYTAIPAYQDGQIVSFVRIAITTEQVQSETTRFIQPIILITFLGILLAIIFATIIAEYLSRPVREANKSGQTGYGRRPKLNTDTIFTG